MQCACAILPSVVYLALQYFLHYLIKYLSIFATIFAVCAKTLRRRTEKQIKDVLGEDQFGFRRGKETRDAI